MNHGPAFPPAGIVIIFGNLLEAELLVVIGTDKFRRIDRALFERRIDIAASNLLGNDAELFHDLAGHAGNAHLKPLQIVDRVDFLAEPAAHLRARIAGRQAIEPLGGVELVHQRVAIALVEPGILQAPVEAEGNGRADRVGRVLAPEVIGAGMGHFHRIGGHRIHRLQARHDLARGKGLDGEIAVCGRREMFRHVFRTAIDRVEAFREGRGQAPGDFRIFLRDGRSRQAGGCGRAQTGRTRFTEECTTIQSNLPFILGFAYGNRGPNHADRGKTYP